MLTAQKILSQIHQAKPLLQEQYNVQEIALFGSYSRNQQNENSDIDVLVSLSSSSYINLCHIKYFLQSIFPENVIQVVTQNGMKPAYFEAIKEDLLYA